MFGRYFVFCYFCAIKEYDTNMKKFIIVMMALVGALTVQANDTYPYLTFETTDGTRASVPVSSLTLTISGTTLTAGEQTFTLSNLHKMYFSMTDESTAGIEEITMAVLDEATDIFDLQGHKVAKDQMKKGVYIVKTKNRTYKMIVR